MPAKKKSTLKTISIIVTGWLLIISLLPFNQEIAARGKKYTSVFHKVKRGEYLGSIARKYGTNISRIIKWNKLKANGILPAGTVIKVGIKKTTRPNRLSKRRKAVYYKVRRGDSLSRIAKKYRTRVSSLRKWNRYSNQSKLIAGKTIVVGYRSVKKRAKSIPEGTRWLKVTKYTNVKLPLNYTPARASKKSFRTPFYKLNVYAAGFKQGRAAYLEILANQINKAPGIHSIQVKFLGKGIPIDKSSIGYRAVFALPPDSKPGRHAIIVSFKSRKKIKRFRHYIPIADEKYPVSVWRRNVGQPGKRKPMSKEKADFIKRSSKIKRLAFKIKSNDKFTSVLSHPRSLHKITSHFFTTRKIVRYYYKNRKRIYLKPLYRMHRGTDLRGLTGAPLYAMADGKVVLSQRMYFEGNFTMIDHGNGIFTGYMHQSKLKVYNGKNITAGQLIGLSGSTGVVTGPHLHMSLWIRGVAVEPLSLLSLPIRN